MVSNPFLCQTPRTPLDETWMPFKTQRLPVAGGAVTGLRERVLQDRLLDLGGDAVGVRPACPGHVVDEALRAVGLEVAADFVELLAGVAHQIASSGYVVEIVRKFEQRQLAACYLLRCGHVRFLRESDEVFGDTI